MKYPECAPNQLTSLFAIFFNDKLSKIIASLPKSSPTDLPPNPQYSLSSFTLPSKKLSMDTLSSSSYRPISNLSTHSKILQPIEAKQLMQYLVENNIPNTYQSAYLPNKSTETALSRMFSDLLRNLEYISYDNLFSRSASMALLSNSSNHISLITPSMHANFPELSFYTYAGDL